MNETLNVIKNRRSTRAFKQEQIKPEELELIVEAGTFAPSGHNSQPWYFTVIQKREVIDHINETSKEVMAQMEIEWMRNAGMNQAFDITYKAPTLIIVSGRKDGITWKTDCAAAIQNMLIAAESLNIGSVWVGFAAFCFNKPGEAEKLGIPAGYEPFYGVALGYKAQDNPPAPERKKDVVMYIR